MRYKNILNPRSIKTIQNARFYPPIQRAFRHSAGLKPRNQGLQSVAKQTSNPQTGPSSTTFLVHDSSFTHAQLPCRVNRIRRPSQKAINTFSWAADQSQSKPPVEQPSSTANTEPGRHPNSHTF
jgi:hypothetical protein